MIRRYSGFLLVLALVLAGCGSEEPTGVGGGLLPGGAVRTFELVLEPEQFLVGDTAFLGIAGPADAGFLVVARDFGGELDANGLVRFPAPPATVEFSDSAGATRSDSVASFPGAFVDVTIDTAASIAPGPVDFALYHVTEAWDVESAGWTLRVDTGSVEEPWTQAGGTRGERLGAAVWSPGDTLVSIHVDSAAVARWAGDDPVDRGGLLVSETPGTRMYVRRMNVRFQARPVPRPDTVVTATKDLTARTFLFHPAPGPASALRVGGTPTWRSVLRFREGLDTLTLPCPGTADGDCRINLTDATLSFATLQLQPVTVPVAFQPEDSLKFGALPLLVSGLAPVSRAPLGTLPGGASQVAVPADLFTSAPSTTEPVEVPITAFLAQLVAERGPDEEPPASALALLGPSELGGVFRTLGTFGFGSFASGAGAAPGPRLRIIVTVATQVEIQ